MIPKQYWLSLSSAEDKRGELYRGAVAITVGGLSRSIIPPGRNGFLPDCGVLAFVFRLLYMIARPEVNFHRQHVLVRTSG